MCMIFSIPSVNRWFWCQLNANDNSPFGVWRQKLYSVPSSSVVIQHGCEESMAVRWLWGQDPPGLDSSACLLTGFLCFVPVRCALPSVLLQCSISSVSAPAGETVYSGKGKCSLRARGSWLIQTEVPSPGPWLVCHHVNVDSKFLQLDCSKSHCPDWSEWSCSGWWVKKLMGR